MADQQPIIAYKAFDKDMQCRGFQYKVGGTYEHKGPVKLCYSGFHACLNPLDCLSYYDLIGTKFAEVVVPGDTESHSKGSKICAATITIKAELKLSGFIKRAVDWIIVAAESSNTEPPLAGASKLAASGEYSQLAASGECSQLAASGVCSQLAASGEYSQLAASGEYSKLAASGEYSKLAASGEYSTLAASGDSSQLAASGEYSTLAASGDSSQLAASGEYSQLAASGEYSKLAASGEYSKLAASGEYSKLAASGEYSKLAASGEYSKLAASGENSVIASSAVKAVASGAEGTWIALAEFDDNKHCVGFAVGCVGENGIKPDTWYRASNGELVELDQ